MNNELMNDYILFRAIINQRPSPIPDSFGGQPLKLASMGFPRDICQKSSLISREMERRTKKQKTLDAVAALPPPPSPPSEDLATQELE